MNRATPRNAVCAILLTLAVCATALGGPKVKGERSYQAYDKIVLVADGLDKGSSVLWDLSGDAQTEESGTTLYVWAKPGRYTVTMTSINFDTKQVTRAKFTFNVQGDTPTPLPPVPPGPLPPGPNPPVPPIPPLPPVPPPNPSPIPADGFRVMIVEDVTKRKDMPASQLAILFDKRVRDYLDSKCVTGPDSKTKEWRIWDQHVDATAESKLWQDAVKRPQKSLPAIIISDGKTGYEGPLPATVDDTLALLKKYGGG